MQHSARWVGVALLAICALFFQQSLALPLSAAWFPRAVIFLLAGQAVMLLATEKAASRHGSAPLNSRAAVTTAVCLVTYVLALEYLGYLIATALFLGALMWLLGQRRWTVLVIVPLSTSAALYLLLQRGFAVPLPQGVIFG